MARGVSRLWLFSVLFFHVAVLLCTTSGAQIYEVGDDTSTPIAGVGHDYIKTLAETVNPANGSVSLRIQVPTAKGRGITLPFSFSYDSNGVNHIVGDVSPGPISDLTAISQGGWSYGLPLLQEQVWSTTTPAGVTCSFNSGYTFQDSSGGRHNLGLATTNYSQGGNQGTFLCSTPVINGGDSQYAASLITTPTAGNLNPAVVVSDADGTIYHFLPTGIGGGPPGCSGCSSETPDYIEDRNGNQIAWSSSSGAYIDTAGRSAIAWTGLGTSGTTSSITVSGMTYQIAWTSTTPNFTFPNKSEYNAPGYLCEPFSPATTAETVVDSITLPNLQKYQFYYGTNNPNGFTNPYGLLSEIDYPTGAWVRYTWKMSDTYSEFVSYSGIQEPGGGSIVPGFCQAIFSTPVVATRAIGLPGSSTPILTQSFTYNTAWNEGGAGGTTWSTKTTTVLTTDSVQGTSQTVYTYVGLDLGPNNPYSGWAPVGSLQPLEKQIQYYPWGNTTTPIRTVNKTWADVFDLASEQTVFENGLSSKEVYTYSHLTSFPQLVEEDDYDFGQAAPSRIKKTAYASFLGSPAVIADKPCKAVVYDAKGKLASETDYLYDGGNVVCGNPGTPSVTSAGGLALTGHDETNFAAASTIARGNQTAQIKRLIGNDGASSRTSYSYDETGQVTSIIDPNGNVTRYSYGDNFLSTNTGSYTTTSGSPPTGKVTNTYLTTITRPSTSTNHITTYTYGYQNGELTTSTDENQKNTIYRYDDLLGRLTETDYPDQGQTTLGYSDAGPKPSVTTTKKLTATANTVSVAMADGFGRLIQTQLTAPEGAILTDTTYTGTGRVATRSNPHHTTSSTTDGTAAYVYDSLGRTQSITQPDGSSIQTTYATSCLPNVNAYGVTVKDEASKSRTTCTDGLGRMTNVFEDPSGLNYETDYQYDVLDNLLSATQKGGSSQANWRLRNFVYDSLSRLTSAQNPETGTVFYSYDRNGNLISKTDARGVQTTVNYDALNRVLSKTYSDGTPTTTFYYDTAPVPWGPGIQNTNGRLVQATTGITLEP